MKTVNLRSAMGVTELTRTIPLMMEVDGSITTVGNVVIRSHDYSLVKATLNPEHRDLGIELKQAFRSYRPWGVLINIQELKNG